MLLYVCLFTFLIVTRRNNAKSQLHEKRALSTKYWLINHIVLIHSQQMALILMYHRISKEESDPWSLCVAPEQFSQQLEVVKRVGLPVHMNQLIERFDNRDSTKSSIVITFDDGFVDNLYQAKPLLETHHVPATIFLVTDYLLRKQEFWFEELEGLLLRAGTLPRKLHLTINGQEMDWELGDSANYTGGAFVRNRNWRALEEPPTLRHSLYFDLWKRLRPLGDTERRNALDQLWTWIGNTPALRHEHCALSVKEAQRLAEGGIFEIGSHTKTHAQLSRLSEAAQRNEVAQSKSFLEDLIGRPVNSFAYPYGGYGDYSPASIACAREAGYRSACTTLPGKVDGDTDRFQLNRVAVGDWNGEEFERFLSGYLRD